MDPATAIAIGAICEDAIRDVLGPPLADVVRGDTARLLVVAPWVKDLARGLQFQSQNGPAEPATADLLASLARWPLSTPQLTRFAEVIDLTVALTLDRVTDHVLGPGACARDPAVNQATAPWLTGLKLGYRIGLVLELLRLSSSK